MKKIIALILAAILVLSMTACSIGDPESTKEGRPMILEEYEE